MGSGGCLEGGSLEGLLEHEGPVGPVGAALEGEMGQNRGGYDEIRYDGIGQDVICRIGEDRTGQSEIG